MKDSSRPTGRSLLLARAAEKNEDLRPQKAIFYTKKSARVERVDLTKVVVLAELYSEPPRNFSLDERLARNFSF